MSRHNGKVAYQNWRRKNVSARDFVAANQGSLGPLTRALSPEMTVTLGRQFMRDPACSAFWPKPVMTGADRDEWARTDPAFKWVKKIPDELLLALCDKRFGVKKNDLFLTKRFHSDLPPTNAKGEVNYHVAEFNRWITDWETELSELQQGGCSFEGINLRQTLINALSPNKMIHDQATVHQTDSVCDLIAHLREWIMNEEETAIGMRNKQAGMLNLIGQGHQTQVLTQTQAPVSTGGRASAPANRNTQSASVLLTQFMEQQQKLIDTFTASGGAAATREAKTPQALPAHLKAIDDTLAKCRGCNNLWNRSRAMPCFKGCKYADHPHYNKNCNNQDPPQKEKLTWAGFRERFPTVTPPRGFVEWEEYIASKDAKKRDRDGNKK